MRRLELTLSTPAANLALDEALLESVEAGELADGALRIWESPRHVVVLGRSSDAACEVQLDACRRDSVEVLRRVSGGATVLLGPGCLVYAVVVNASSGDRWQSVDLVHEFVLDRMATALRQFAPRIVRSGTSDLAVPCDDDRRLRKVSGNSLRMKRHGVLYHGTLLYDFDAALLQRWLGWPARQPEYRDARSHSQFVANLPATRDQLIAALTATWRAEETLDGWPRQRTEILAAERYVPLT